MSDMNDYEKYIHLSRYARYRDDLGRRETWEETVDRYVEYWKEKYPKKRLPWTEIREAILNREVMPSMRCLMSAGKALDKDNVAGYNCAYLPIDTIRAFDETLYILMCGTGVGFSVERQYVDKLPTVAEEFNETDTVIHVADSKTGWQKAFRELLALLFNGQVPRWDLQAIRPAGSRLKTFGGRSSGPEPLERLFRYSVELFRGAQGRKLTPLECHDLMCMVAEVVVAGGVRRSALISLSDVDNREIQHAKDGNWFVHNKHRSLANNSACYTSKPPPGVFLSEFASLVRSGSGERGIFSRTASRNVAARSGRRDPDHLFGTNPCSEIILRPNQFCNLTEVVVEPDDTTEDLTRKVRIATILGTLQSTLTNFRGLRVAWRNNTEDERLLGVSLTGICDHPVLSDKGSAGVQIELLRDAAIKCNRTYANRLGVPASAAITCVKPSGTVSQLCGSSSGIHPRYAPYYIRRVRADKADPLVQFMEGCGFESEEDYYNKNAVVFSFPIASPEGSVCTKDCRAIEQLELWKVYAEHWCEHKPSVTIYVREDEWLDVAAWVYNNFDIMSGVSFLPYEEHSYKQPPYEEITKEQYEEMLANVPKNVDWTEFKEEDDMTIASQELACTSGGCEI